MQLRTQRKSERMLGIAFLCSSFLPIFGCVLAIVAGFSAPSFGPMHFVAMGCCLVFFVLILALSAVYFFMPKLFPSVFQVNEGKIQYLKGSKVLGQIPLANVMSIEVLRPADSAKHQSAGLDTAMAALAYAEGTGIAFIVHNEEDEDTFWPNELQMRRTKFKIEIRFDMSYQVIHDTIKPLLPNLVSNEKEFVDPSAEETPKKKKPKKADEPPTGEDNPFNFG